MPADLGLSEVAAVDRGEQRLVVRDGGTTGTHDLDARARERLGCGRRGLAVGVEHLQAGDGGRRPARADVAVVRHLGVQRLYAGVVVEHRAIAVHRLRGEAVDVVAEAREADVAAGRVVVAEGRAVRQVRRLVVRHVQRAEVARRGGLVDLAHGFTDRHEGLVAEQVTAAAADTGALDRRQVAVRQLGTCHERQRIHAVNVVVRLRRLVQDVVVIVVEAHPEVLERRQREVGRGLDTADGIRGRPELLATERTVLAVQAPAGEVRHGVATTGDRTAEGRGETGFRQVVLEHFRLDDLVGRVGAAVELRRTACLRGILCKAGVRRDAIRELHGILLCGERPARCTLRPDLREDLDHAVGGFRAVQRCRGGTLQHFHALDGVRIDVVEARRGTTTTTGTL